MDPVVEKVCTKNSTLIWKLRFRFQVFFYTLIDEEINNADSKSQIFVSIDKLIDLERKQTSELGELVEINTESDSTEAAENMELKGSSSVYDRIASVRLEFYKEVTTYWNIYVKQFQTIIEFAYL